MEKLSENHQKIALKLCDTKFENLSKFNETTNFVPKKVQYAPKICRIILCQQKMQYKSHKNKTTTTKTKQNQFHYFPPVL